MNTKRYNKVVEELSNRLYRFVLKSLKDEESAQDIVQEAFLKLWQNRHKIEEGKEKAWMFTTSYNLMINWIKKNKRMSRMEEGGYQIPMAANDDFVNREWLEQGLDKLTELQRSIILLRDLEGYSYKDVGDILGLNESQVKVYLFRSRNKLKEHLEKLLTIKKSYEKHRTA